MAFLFRVSGYALTSAVMFVADIALVYAMTEYLHVYYVESVVFGFMSTTALSFFVNRSWVFPKYVPVTRGGYALLVASTTLGVVTVVTYALVEYGGLYYIYARVLAAGIGFIWSYLADSRFTYQVHPFV